MRHFYVAPILFCVASIAAQEEADTLAVEDLQEDTTATVELSAPVQEDVGDTLETTTQAETDTTPRVPEEEAVRSLESGYKGLTWGMDKEQLLQRPEAESAVPSGRDDAAVTVGVIGEDSVKIGYHFSDKGFWKVSIEYLFEESELEKYLGHFLRIEKFLTKRYGPPIRTTQNDMGIQREYLFSDFPKLARAYFRTSWEVGDVRIELLLNAVLQKPDDELPVFDDVIPLLNLYYYHPGFYQSTEPATTEIPEEKLLDAY